MKNYLLVMSICVLTLQVFSQSTEWTKDDRNNVYSEYLNALTKYKNVTNEQKESISLCCLEEITKKYTKKEYQAKIDIEIKRIQEAMINLCAKNIGVDLSKPNNEVEKVDKPKTNDAYTKESLDGVWDGMYNGAYDGTQYTFYSVDGEFKLKSSSRDTEARGKWYLDGKTLILEDTKTFLKWGSGKFEIKSVSNDEIIFTNGRSFKKKK